jgi:hypothetical protein
MQNISPGWCRCRVAEFTGAMMLASVHGQIRAGNISSDPQSDTYRQSCRPADRAKIVEASKPDLVPSSRRQKYRVFSKIVPAGKIVNNRQVNAVFNGGRFHE